MVGDVQRPGRLTIHFCTNGFAVFTPGSEIPAKGMKHQYLLGTGRDHSSCSREKNDSTDACTEEMCQSRPIWGIACRHELSFGGRSKKILYSVRRWVTLIVQGSSLLCSPGRH